MAKAKSIYVCNDCGYESPRWYGKCPACEAWNTLEEALPVAAVAAAKPKEHKQRGGTGAEALPMNAIEADLQLHQPTGIGELDRVLGGGIVEGSLLLLGGEPGVGKSTLLLQMCAHLANRGKHVLYISGEESARQLKLRARRVGADGPGLLNGVIGRFLSRTGLDLVAARLFSPPDELVEDYIKIVRQYMAADPAATAKVQAYMRLTLTPIMPAAAGSSDPALICRPKPVRVTTRCVAYSSTMPCTTGSPAQKVSRGTGGVARESPGTGTRSTSSAVAATMSLAHRD